MEPLHADVIVLRYLHGQPIVDEVLGAPEENENDDALKEEERDDANGRDDVESLKREGSKL